MLQRGETEWPKWIWCTNDAGKSVWVPENWVEIEGDHDVDEFPQRTERAGE